MYLLQLLYFRDMAMYALGRSHLNTSDLLGDLQDWQLLTELCDSRHLHSIVLDHRPPKLRDQGEAVMDAPTKSSRSVTAVATSERVHKPGVKNNEVATTHSQVLQLLYCSVT